MVPSSQRFCPGRFRREPTSPISDEGGLPATGNLWNSAPSVEESLSRGGMNIAIVRGRRGPAFPAETGVRGDRMLRTTLRLLAPAAVALLAACPARRNEAPPDVATA